MSTSKIQAAAGMPNLLLFIVYGLSLIVFSRIYSYICIKIICIATYVQVLLYCD